MFHGFFCLIFFFLFMGAIAPRALAQEAISCSSSESQCEAYLCLEEQMNCGEKGYLKEFGYQNCQKYLDSEEFVSESLKSWYAKVRLCLQNRAIEIVANGEEDSLSCQKLKDKAFQSHVRCYIETGFCQLDFFDKLDLARITGSDLFKVESLKTEAQINKFCLKEWL